MKTKKLPKCPKTVSGKHKWGADIKSVPKYEFVKRYDPIFKMETSDLQLTGWGKIHIYPVCEYCGLIDDRKE
jgi:hypothetical protein